jgi:hypothetical protein
MPIGKIRWHRAQSNDFKIKIFKFSARITLESNSEHDEAKNRQRGKFHASPGDQKGTQVEHQAGIACCCWRRVSTRAPECRMLRSALFTPRLADLPLLRRSPQSQTRRRRDHQAVLQWGPHKPSIDLNRPMRDHMISIIPTEFVWLATGFIMLMAAFLAAAAE